jgi:cytochrome bd-type quinol oxidase subunit 2
MSDDFTLTLSRLQFALTIMFHYLFPPLSNGLGTLMVIMEGMYLWTKDPEYQAMMKFWTRIFAVNFAIYLRRPFHAFISSSCTIAAFTFLFGLTLYPNLIVAHDPQHSVTVDSAASSPKTLGIMQVIALLGMPFVLSYTAVIYWVFRGKVQLGKFSY